MTKTKQQIQDEIAELQKQLEEMDRQQYYLFIDGAIAINPIKDIFTIVEDNDKDDYDQPHGLGKFADREEAEVCKAVLIGALDFAKNQNTLNIAECMIWNRFRDRGQHVIKAIEEGTYE